MSDNNASFDYRQAFEEEKIKREELEVTLVKRTQEDEAKRLVLEKMLDEKTKEVESGINMIQYQYDNILKKKKELELFLSFAKLAQKSLSFDAIIATFINEMMQFMNAKVAFPVVLKSSEWISVSNPKCHYPQTEDITSVREAIDEIIKEVLEKACIKQKIQPMPGFEQVCCQLAIPLMSEKSIKAISIFIIETDSLFEEITIDQFSAASEQIRIVLEKQQSAQRLEASFRKLNKAHHELKEAQGQLVQSEKMASLGQLSAGVAHEINNPIGFVLSNLDIIQEYATDLFEVVDSFENIMQEKAMDNLQTIKSEKDYNYIRDDLDEIMKDTRAGLIRVRDIVSDLKNFSRIDQSEYQPISLAEVIRSSLKLVSNEIKYNCKVHEDLDEKVWINGSAGQLGQVIVNFLVNASQAIEDNGDLFIEVKLNKNKAVMTIRDTGCGIDEETKKKIFDPFFTTKPVGVGTGLGLSVSFSIIEKHAGFLTVESKVGEGTEFKVEFPAVEMQETDNTQAS